MQLNEEQTLAVEHPVGSPACLIAGAGSGKTRVLQSRVEWLISMGIPPRRLLAITFTNKASSEILSRIVESNPSLIQIGPRVCTIHSLALSAIRKNPIGFGLQAKVTPLDDYDQIEMFKKIIGREDSDIKPWDVRDKISYHRARAVGFAVDYTNEVHQEALKRHSGYHAMTKDEHEIWQTYEKEKQCHPPGTLVWVVRVPPLNSRAGYRPAILEWITIEQLRDDDLVVAWKHGKDFRTIYSGRKVRVASRNYRGDLLTVTVGTDQTRVTPSHYFWVRFNPELLKKQITYLMYRKDRGFRVGVTCFENGNSGPSARFNAQKAEKIWILRVCESRAEAELWEDFFSVHYGIPQTLYDAEDSIVDRMFNQHDSQVGGLRCLEDNHLLEDYPLFERGVTPRGAHLRHRFFKTAACNLLQGQMNVPAVTRPGNFINRGRIPDGLPIDSLKRERYDGKVYSLDVAEFHTYVADGIIVGNCNSVVDFDDMVHLCVRRGRQDEKWRAAVQRMFDHVLMDEAQDTNPVQWEFVNMLLSPTNMNMYVVGDMSQCQPSGTMVRVPDEPMKAGRKGRGFISATSKDVPIETLMNEELALSWTRQDDRVYKKGRKIHVASRWYTGDLLRVYSGGESTRVTLNHWFWAKFHERVLGTNVVYLMFKRDKGFRVGVSKLHRGKGGINFYNRGRVVQAERVWILDIVADRQEAHTLEAIYSFKFGVPMAPFCEYEGRSQALIDRIFAAADSEAGHRLLASKGLLFEFPFLSFPRERCQKMRGYFKVAAANLLPGIMHLPTLENCKCAVIEKIEREHYEGLVHSLDVEKDHTYIADGIPVGNSIYGFSGAVPELLKEYSEGWRGVVPALYKIVRNHRSGKNIVNLANSIQTKMTQTIPLRMESYRGEQGFDGDTRIMQADTPRDIARSIASEIHRDNLLKTRPFKYKDNAILVRSGRSQIRDIEAELVAHHIPYIVRGGRSLLQTEEVRDVLSYLRVAVNPKDFTALVRSSQVPKRGVGEKSLEKIREAANQVTGGDLINYLSINRTDKLSLYVELVARVVAAKDDPFKAIDVIMAGTRYQDYIREKYKKEREKVEMKLENLDRLAEMIRNIQTFTPGITTEDIVFQLTMHDTIDPKDEAGKVVVSTIHAAKGLEWPRVFVPVLYEGSLPHKFCLGSENEIEEERRLWYVACTRAKDMLKIGIPDKIQVGPNVQSVRPSRFLEEVGIGV
jgi:DNA helicase-2/ATP-dependent DNA helicase PcrA